MSHNPNLLIILGPTASGKTHLGVELARRYDGEVISADSRQVYRGLDIGSGKDLSEYQEIPYHLIDIIEPGEEYSVFQFQRDFFKAFEDIRARGTLPVRVGGTGLYVDAVVRGYRFVEAPEQPELRQQWELQPLEQLQAELVRLKPEQHNQTDLLERPRLYRALEIALAEQEAERNDAPLPEIRPFYLSIDWPRPVLRARITERLNARLQEGLLEEVQDLLDRGISMEHLHYLGLEYRFVGQHLTGQLNYNDMRQKLNSAIHQYAKRQDTWLRKLERRGETLHRLAGDNDPVAQAESLIQTDWPTLGKTQG